MPMLAKPAHVVGRMAKSGSHPLKCASATGNRACEIHGECRVGQDAVRISI